MSVERLHLMRTTEARDRDRDRDRPSRVAVGATVNLDRVVGRAIDLTLVIGGLIFLAPLMLTVALVIWAQDGGPVLYGQRRIGRDGRLFRCWKFRSMVQDADDRLKALLAIDADSAAEWAEFHKLRADPRITPLGHFLRKSSLDELPQLFNVLVGEMNLVGPRPIVPAETEKYGRYLEAYCRVRPGITGLWQVSGRNDTSYRRRVAIDVVYVRRRSVGFDLKILVQTVPAVLQSRGSY